VKQNLTQKKLAQTSKVSERQIISIESGEDDPRLSTIQKLMIPLRVQKVEDIFPLALEICRQGRRKC
jgi:DNA-binding XRE family transcriptional regulator